MPVLINKFQERVTVTKVKKMYSTLNQAVKLAEVDNGSVNTWDLPAKNNGGSQKLYSYLKPYLRVAKECVEDNSGNCLDTNTDYYYFNGTKWTTPNTSYGDKSFVRLILADGSLLWFRSNISIAGCTGIDSGLSNACGLFLYDVNGSAKPNIVGKDIFTWYLTYDKDFSFKHGVDYCYLKGAGWSCSMWILEHDNMDYPETEPQKS